MSAFAKGRTAGPELPPIARMRERIRRSPLACRDWDSWKGTKMVEQTDEEFIAEIAALAGNARAAPASFTAAGPRISRLLAIIKRLEKEGDELYAAANHFHLAIIARLEKAERERDAALAKVERLTEALESIKDNNMRWAQETAAAALKAEE